jgi:hypothetical protein
MTKARTLADNFAADINAVTAGTGITGGGTSGTVTVTNSMATEIDAKGDLVVGTGADTFSRLAVASTAGYLLSVDSGETTGLKWVAPATSAFVGWSAYLTSATLAITTATGTSVGMDAEDLDTDGFHDNVTNNSRFTIPAGKGGKYLITVGVEWAATGSTAIKETGLRKNGNFLFANLFNLASQNPITFSYILDLVATDYIEVYVYHNFGSNANLNGSGVGNGKITYCHGTYLGA